jgi:hypothetical protein
LDGEHITWYVSGGGDQDAQYYEVLLSTTGNNAEDFDILLFSETLEGQEWRYRGADLSEWWGQSIYIAFRHVSNGGGIMLKLDDVLYPTWTNPGQDCTINVAELSENPLSVFPNPASDVITVKCAGNGTVEIFDASGRQIRRWVAQRSADIGISDLAEGMYTIKFIDADGFMKTLPLSVIRK